MADVGVLCLGIYKGCLAVFLHREWLEGGGEVMWVTQVTRQVGDGFEWLGLGFCRKGCG